MSTTEKTSTDKAANRWREWGFKGKPKPTRRPSGPITHSQYTNTLAYKKPTKPTYPKRKLQTTLHGSITTQEQCEEYGHILIEKETQYLRYLGGNINNLHNKTFYAKSAKAISMIREAEADVVGITEMGRNFAMADVHGQWAARFPPSMPVMTNTEHNTNNTLSEIDQPGGVSVTILNEAIHRFKSFDSDPTHLGRWTSCCLQGRQGYRLRIVVIYSPNPTTGETTVHTQQTTYWRQHLVDEEATDRLRRDVKQSLTNWLEDGEELIVNIDANEDVRKGKWASLFQSMGLYEIIKTTHEPKGPMPATHNRNKRGIPIDGLFTTLHNTGDIKCGMLPFDEGLPGDHRTLWMDIPFTQAFGHNPPHINKIKAPMLNPKDPRIRDRYNRRVITQFAHQGVFEKTEHLRRMVGERKDIEQIIKLHHSLAKTNYQIREAAVNKLRRKKLGRVQYSPRMKRLFDQKELWKLIVKKKLRVQTSNKKIRKLMHQCETPQAFTVTLEQAQKNRNKAQLEFLQGKKNAPNWRIEHRKELAAAIAEEKGTNADTEYSNLNRNEKQRNIARRIKVMRQKTKGGKVTRLFKTTYQTVTNPISGQEEEIPEVHTLEDQQEMEQAEMEEGEARFTRSLATPSMEEPLRTILGFLGDTATSRKILADDYDPPPEVDHYTALFLKALATPNAVTQMPIQSLYISQEENTKAWKKQKLNTAAEPSDLSFAHYIAGAQHSEISEVDAALRSAPYEMGFSPETWQTITDYALLKKAGVYDVEKMRMIQLMHAAFNMNNKKLGRDMMKHAEQDDTLAPEQDGSRQGRTSGKAALKKVLTADISRQQRIATAILSNDATQCYDKMNHNTTALAMRRMGVPGEPINSMFLTLQRATHYVTTAYGVSAASYGGTKRMYAGLSPLMGIGQGNGCGPAGFAVLSTVIMQVLRAKHLGAHLSGAISGITLAFLCFMFVDDADLASTAHDNTTTGEDIIPDMQLAAAHWEGALRATGGELSHKKSFWYLLDYQWRRGGWKYRSITDMPGNVAIHDVDGTLQNLARHDPSHPEVTLGISWAPDGNMQGEEDLLLGKGTDYADSVRSHRSKERNDVWISFTSGIMKTFDYPMIATTLKRQAWERIMKPVLKVVLPCSGIVRTFPRLLVYAPTEFQGLGIIHPWYQQELRHMAVFLEELTDNSFVGSLLQISMESLRLEIGTPDPMTQTHPHRDLSLTTCWLKDMMLNARDFGIDIQDKLPTVSLSRQNDEFLMHSFILNGKTEQELKMLNECRMFLNVITLADITTACGRRIAKQSFEGTKTSENKIHRYNWPRQPPSLTVLHWNLWQETLTNCYIDCYSAFRLLKRPLGSWLYPPTQWTWYYNAHSNSLFYQAHSGEIREYKPVRGGTFTDFRQADTLPEQSRLASIEHLTQGHVRMRGSCPIPSDPQTEERTYNTLKEVISALHQHDKWTIDKCRCSDNGLAVAESIINGTAKAVSDGSYKNNFSTSAFVLEGSNRKQQIKGVNRIPGGPLEQNSYRAELGGISGIISVLWALCKLHDITTGKVTIGLDGEQALKAAKSQWSPKAHDPCYDLLTDIRKKLARLPITIGWIWIASHQDSKQNAVLDRWAQLNVSVDLRAKTHWQRSYKVPQPNRQLGDERVIISFHGRKLPNFNIKEVYGWIKEKEIKSYWSNKHNIDDTAMDYIAWPAQGKAWRNQSMGYQRWLIKHISGHSGVGKMLLRRKYQDHSECPRCQETEEDTLHVITCPHPEATMAWTNALGKFRNWMSNSDTDPTISSAIIAQLRAWRMNAKADREYYSPTIRKAVRQQQQIGWHNFLLGRPSKEWATAQELHFQSIHREKSGMLWLRGLIEATWRISWAMWEHRNEMLHHTMTPNKLAQQAKLHDQIRREFATGPEGLMPWDRHKLFNKARILSLPLSHTKLWVEQMRLARLFYKRYTQQRQQRTHQELQRSRTFMRNWLAGRANAPATRARTTGINPQEP